jgi:hypothetical protein
MSHAKNNKSKIDSHPAISTGDTRDFLRREIPETRDFIDSLFKNNRRGSSPKSQPISAKINL